MASAVTKKRGPLPSGPSENHFEIGFSNWALAELVEAAARSEVTETTAGALRRFAEMTSAIGTDWACGLHSVGACAAERGQGGRGILPRGDFPAGPDPHSCRACPRPPAVRGVA